MTDRGRNTAPVAETIDAFLGGALMLRQPAHGYRAGLDPILLAATCKGLAGQHILDCGAGVGTVGLAIARRLPDVHITLVERDPFYAGLARTNCCDNGLVNRVDIIEADLTGPIGRVPELAKLIGTVDHGVANPPYHIEADGTQAADPLKAAANAMPADGLDAWARFLAAMVKPGGTATIIYPASALTRVLIAFESRFGSLIVRPIQPAAGTSANRVIVRGIRGSRGPLILKPPLIIHSPDGGFDPAISAVLRHSAAIDL